MQSHNLHIGRYDNTFILDKNNLIIIGNDNLFYQNSSMKFNYSEIIFNQALLAIEKANMNISDFHIKSWIGKHVNNESTRNIVKLFLPEERGPDGLVKGGKKEFKLGDDGFIALAATETAQSKFYLSAQHQKALKGKKVTSIIAERKPGGSIRITYQYNS